MAIAVEVCVDNIESVVTAVDAGASRIELCGALSVGGITPNAGLIQKSLDLCNIPIHVMIRPRGGDFVFSRDEIDIMVADIKFMQILGVKGVAFGALTEKGEIDDSALTRLMSAARGMDVTFHRAFDLCRNPYQALETAIDFGCDRILTSGLKANAVEGVELLAQLVKRAGKRIKIMPGGGITPENAATIVNTTGVQELHLSGKVPRFSKMSVCQEMEKGISDISSIDVTSFEKIDSIITLFQQ